MDGDRTAIGRLLLSIIAAGGLGACSGGGDVDAALSADDAGAPAIPVEVSVPARGDIVSRFSGTAPIEAFADATVIAKTGGEITAILVEEGDDVSTGQVLARLDGDRLRLTLAETRARLDKLRQDFSRNVELKDRNLISAGDFEKIRYDMEELEASHELARLELSYTEIRAPIDGVVSERFIKLGNTIEPNTAAFEVTSLNPLVAYLHVPEREYRRMRQGLIADISVDALPGTSFEGVVARTSPVVDPDTGTFKLTIEVTDDERRLKPGMFGRISIVSDRHEDALKIPRNAIVENEGDPFVYVVAGGKAEKRPIDTGFVEGSFIEVRGGLDASDRVVVVGQGSLKSGVGVSIVSTSRPAETAAHNPGS